MTPQAATRLTIHERVPGEASASAYPRRRGPGRAITPAPVFRSAIDRNGEIAHPWLLKRESIGRRLLGLSDGLAAMLAVAIVLVGVNGRQEALPLLVAAPLLILLFKLAGLY